MKSELHWQWRAASVGHQEGMARAQLNIAPWLQRILAGIIILFYFIYLTVCHMTFHFLFNFLEISMELILDRHPTERWRTWARQDLQWLWAQPSVDFRRPTPKYIFMHSNELLISIFVPLSSNTIVYPTSRWANWHEYEMRYSAANLLLQLSHLYDYASAIPQPPAKIASLTSSTLGYLFTCSPKYIHITPYALSNAYLEQEEKIIKGFV